MENNQPKNLANKVMDQIHQKKAKMHSRAYFIAGSLLLGLGLFGIFLLAIFCFNLSTFHYRMHGPLGYLGFGQPGIRPFMATFPWVFLFLTLIAILGGAMLLRRYDVSYHHSFVFLIIWFVALILGAGFFLDQIGLSEKAAKIKPIQRLFNSQLAGESWVVGEIVEIKKNKNQAIIMTPQGEEISVVWDKDTSLPAGQNFVLGDQIRIVGKWQEDQFNAQAIGQGCPACERIKTLKTLEEEFRILRCPFHPQTSNSNR